TAAPTLAGDGLSGGLRAQARLASGADPLAPAAGLRERDPTPPGGGAEERGERVLGTLFRPRAPGRTGRRRERLETSRSLAQASPRPPLTCYPCGRSKMLPMCRAVPRGPGSGWAAAGGAAGWPPTHESDTHRRFPDACPILRFSDTQSHTRRRRRRTRVRF